jgi:DNA-binding GntR family transcriptional regulator
MTDAVEHRPLREIVAERIRAMILGGVFQPGERLIEGHIADQLGVSRNPVREAIRSLEATGLIEVIPRKGAHVSRVDLEEVRQIQELRFVIESFAAELAAKRRTDDDIKRLTECIEKGLAATKSGDKVGAAAWHRDFHIALEDAGGNPYIQRALHPLRQRTELVFSMLQEERGEITWKEHRAIRDAVAKGSARQARDLMREHISVSVRHFALAED